MVSQRTKKIRYRVIVLVIFFCWPTNKQFWLFILCEILVGIRHPRRNEPLFLPRSSSYSTKIEKLSPILQIIIQCLLCARHYSRKTKILRHLCSVVNSFKNYNMGPLIPDSWWKIWHYLLKFKMHTISVNMLLYVCRKTCYCIGI